VALFVFGFAGSVACWFYLLDFWVSPLVKER